MAKESSAVYRVTDVIGTSPDSWEDAARNAVKMAAKSLRNNLMRTLLTLLGIIIGVASVVAMLAIGDGAKQQVLDRISAMGTNRATNRSRRR